MFVVKVVCIVGIFLCIVMFLECDSGNWDYM